MEIKKEVCVPMPSTAKPGTIIIVNRVAYKVNPDNTACVIGTIPPRRRNKINCVPIGMTMAYNASLDQTTPFAGVQQIGQAVRLELYMGQPVNHPNWFTGVGGTPPYSYRLKHPPQRLNGGTLIVGVTYTIRTYFAGDDFLNVGASSNAMGEQFVATGTTPNNWVNNSLLLGVLPAGSPMPYHITQQGNQWGLTGQDNITTGVPISNVINYFFTVIVTDANGCTGEQEFYLTYRGS